MGIATRTPYRHERMAIVVTMVVLGMVLSVLIPLPSRQVVLHLFGSELALRFSGSVQLLLVLGAIVSAGVDSLVRSSWESLPSAESSFPSRGLYSLVYSATFWPLPCIVTILGLRLMHNLAWWGHQMAWAILVAGGVATVISFQLRTQSPSKTDNRALRLVLNGIAYVTAYALFSIVYGARLRSVLSATGILLVSGALALELFRNVEPRPWRSWLYAAIVALVLGQLTWALNYTQLSNRSGGALLLLGYYTLTGLVQQHFWKRLTRRVVIEYATVLIAGLIVLIVVF